MSFDLAVGVVVLVFVVVGAFTGFARQVAQAAAAVTAFLLAGPAGRLLGSRAAQALEASQTVGVVAATVLAFLLSYVLVRAVLTLVIRRVLAGRDETNQARDRVLGGALSGFKAASVVWLGLSAVTFLENNLVVAGKRYTFTPKNSVLVPLARQYNLLELQQFAGTKDLAKALKVASDPKSAGALKADPDYLALMKDPRFKGLLGQAGLQKALERGELSSLLTSSQLVELLHDPRLREHLERLGARAEPKR